jgi:hypothetical protein
MSKKRHHQRRRRYSSAVWVFKALTALGQAAFYVARFWIWISDRE